MKLDSKLFDGIRIRPRHQEEPAVAVPSCDWEGCDLPGTYKAPKGPRAEGQFHNFCLEHVRHYNKAFNFFAGMKPEEIDEHLTRTAQTDGRPTWGLGAKPGAAPKPKAAKAHTRGDRFHDPLHVFARYARSQARTPEQERVKPVLEHDRRALEALGLDVKAKSADIKAAYKALVKIHHPDANGGDRSSEDRLRAIISAYSQLKKSGLVVK